MDTKRSGTLAYGNRVARLRAAGLLCAVAVAGALVTGCGDDNGGGGGGSASPKASEGGKSAVASPTASGKLTEDQTERKALIPKAKITYDKALSAATGAVSGSKPVSAELKRGTGGKPVWETEVATTDGTKSMVTVDAVSGKAAKPRTDSDEDADDKTKLAAWLKKAKVTAQQAAQVATDKKQGTVSSIELDDNDQGKEIWSVDVVTKSDWNKTTYDIDAADKKVLRTHVDRD
ncbi:PepSY domain-containing protein [Streptomyces purpurogeneiscleroticus]|uniref:PepSY domain-containing protein n=1 Tax=Streptomyces purpurogeneiscleroticus TaxID=68259 RepID=UPI001CBEB948|nr:PepSY domain-containing protein [Streptomyces purpurogeneiscleroticus]MBZ4018946.1 peptidase M4 [Streptomyces purpurogeneiscleroticus]